MRSVRMALFVMVLVAAAAAHPVPGYADPPPAPPSLPDLSGLPPLPDASGSLLPNIQQWIDAVLPAPPIAPVPRADSSQPAGAGDAPDVAALRSAILPSAVGDAFFDEWPADLDAAAPGQILAVRDIGTTAAALVLIPFGQAVQIKYRTTDSAGRPSFATATLVVPNGAWTGPGQRPVLVDNLPIDGLGRDCTIGYNMAHPFQGQTSVTDYIPPAMQLALARGYAVLLPDHEGPWMAYAEPVVAGRAVLDGIRAVRALRPREYGASPYGIIGYSGGAIATNGAVKQMGEYAPELADVVVGAALGGVPADFQMLAGSMNANLASGVFMGAVFGIAREHTEMLTGMNHLAQWLATSPLKDSCASTFGALGALLLPIDVAANFPDPLRSELAAGIYRATRMDGAKSPVPLYIYNGEQEFWIPADGARNLFREQCGLGVPAVYRSVPGEHIIAAGLGFPEAVVWMDDRLRGLPAPDEC